MYGLEKAKEGILKANEIMVASHLNPDGDSIGSLLALGLGMERLGKRVYMVSPDGVPKKYRKLPGANRIKLSMPRSKSVDLAIAVDCSSKEILGSAFKSFKKARNILEIDHHDFRRPFGNISLIDSKAAAVSELIYILLKDAGVHITKDIAYNLLTSIIVETNSFRLPNVRPFTFEVCTNLISSGVDFYKLAETVFWAKTKESVVLSGLCLSRCKFKLGGKIAWSIIRKKDFASAGGKDEDVDQVADDIRTIREVEVIILFREKDRKTLRVSLRSKNKVNVATIAEYYGGGGHFDVAGCQIPNSPKSINEFLKRAEGLILKTR